MTCTAYALLAGQFPAVFQLGSAVLISIVRLLDLRSPQPKLRRRRELDDLMSRIGFGLGLNYILA